MAKWFLHTKKADFKAIGAAHGVDQVIARILVNRGLTEQQEIHEFLHPVEQVLYSGSYMKDMAKAVSLIQEGIYQGKKIKIIGDYDVDGVQSTYILHQGLLRCGGKVTYGIPHRMWDGYGLSEGMIEQCQQEEVDMIITCDNGIGAKEAIALAKEKGMQVIVTDHHEVPKEGEEEVLPPADAIINPKQQACGYPFKKLCGAAVAWKLIQQLYEAMEIPQKEADIFLEHVAFATVCDVMELVGENRSIVAKGLAAMEHTKNMGMQTLKMRCGLEETKLSAYHLGFVLGPCINASGRLESAAKSLELLESKDYLEATKLAQDLVDLNEARKVMTEQGVDQACEYVETNCNKQDLVLVVYLPKVHESIAGIIAGRVRERYHRPAFVLTEAKEEGMLKGSGRSVEGFSMFEEMSKCKELFVNYGGHPMAAGLSLPRENLEAFRRAINENTQITEEMLEGKIYIDVPMPFSYLSEELILQLQYLEPFGAGNEKPVFAQKDVSFLQWHLIGKERKFCKGKVKGTDGAVIEALYFGNGEAFLQEIEKRQQLHVLYYPQINTYQGRKSIQIVITDYS